MYALYAGIVLVVCLAAFLIFRLVDARAARRLPDPQALLLEEATVTEPIGPGLEGRAEIRKGGGEALTLRVRATDAGQAFARGARVRIIDFREGCCFIESADEEHLVH